MVESSLVAAYIGCILIALALWVFIIYFQIKMWRSVRPGADFLFHSYLVFRPELLSEEGLRYRRTMLKLMLGLLAAVAGCLAVAFLGNQL
jgi:hypothetical protein